MKKLILLLVLAAATSVAAQTYSIPRNMPIERAAKREFREWWQGSGRYPAVVPEKFFPIGWSKDGKFAYYVEPVDEACGCYFANLVIQDMRTDKVVWEFKYRQDDLMDQNGKMPPEDNLQKLWRKNKKLFSEKLRENDIVARQSVLLGKTFAAAGRSFTAKAGITKGKDEDGTERVNRYSVTLTAPKLGSKSLFTSDDHTKDQYWYMLDAGLIGVVKSPFEDRVAVIAMEVNKGYEGPPHTGDIRIVGADLKSGF